MSKHITESELAALVATLIVSPGGIGHNSTQESHQRFLHDIAGAVCGYCGGNVAGVGVPVDQIESPIDTDAVFRSEYSVFIESNEVLPKGESVWSPFDLHNTNFTEVESERLSSILIDFVKTSRKAFARVEQRIATTVNGDIFATTLEKRFPERQREVTTFDSLDEESTSIFTANSKTQASKERIYKLLADQLSAANFDDIADKYRQGQAGGSWVNAIPFPPEKDETRMIGVFTSEVDCSVSYMEQMEKDDQAIEAYANKLREQAGSDETIVGEEIQFRAGDGYARYLVAKESPLCLVHLAVGDAWSIPDPHIRGLTLDDVREMVERSKVRTHLKPMGGF